MYTCDAPGSAIKGARRGTCKWQSCNRRGQRPERSRRTCRNWA
jgi:CRISPR/Cas system CSM-associated protein Csm5 (group 7 of RAMP superfamily)